MIQLQGILTLPSEPSLDRALGSFNRDKPRRSTGSGRRTLRRRTRQRYSQAPPPPCVACSSSRFSCAASDADDPPDPTIVDQVD